MSEQLPEAIALAGMSWLHDGHDDQLGHPHENGKDETATTTKPVVHRTPSPSSGAVPSGLELALPYRLRTRRRG